MLQCKQKKYGTKRNSATKLVINFTKTFTKKRNVENCKIAEMVQDIPKLTVKLKNIEEKKKTLEEATRALKNTKHNKSPGTDGFKSEFFCFVFNGILGILL